MFYVCIPVVQVRNKFVWFSLRVRFIIHNEVANQFSSLLDDFVNEMAIFSPKLLVVGGLRMMLHRQSRDGELNIKFHDLVECEYKFCTK